MAPDQTGPSKGVKYFILVAAGFMFTMVFMMLVGSNNTIHPKMIEILRQRVPIFNTKYAFVQNYSDPEELLYWNQFCPDCVSRNSIPGPKCTDCETKMGGGQIDFFKLFGNYKFREPDCNGKLLVYECGAGLCGGLGDREKGIMSAFLLALLTNRTLVIDHRKPCDIKKFLEPNLYDWSKCIGVVGSSRSKGSRMVHYIDGKGALPANYSKSKPGDMWNEHVVTIHINIRIQDRLKDHPDAPKMMPWLMTSPPEEVITGLMHLLFKPEVTLRDHINSFIEEKSKNRTFIGVHIRSAFLKKETDVPIVFDFLAQFSDKDKYCLYVASDDISIRNKAKETFKNFASVERQIVHVDQSNKPCDGMYTAVFEQQILSKADTLVMTPSGFSRLAAYIRGISDRIYLFDLKKGTRVFEKIPLKQLPILFKVG